MTLTKGIFTDKAFLKKLIHLSLPIVFQNFMLAAVAAADSVMLGKVEQNYIAAVSLATQIQFLQNMLVSGIVASVLALGGQYWGKEDRKTLGDIFCISLRVGGLLSLVFCLACELIPGTLMTLFTDEAVLIEIGSDYLRIAGWSYLLTGISQSYLAMMKVTDHVKASAYVSVFTVLANILLNSVFIFGLFGLPAMNANGAALATLLARVMEMTIMVFLSFRKGFLRPTLKGMFRIHRLLSRDFARCVLPLMGAALVWTLGFTVYASVMGHLGVDVTAANAVAAVVRELICCLCVGVGSAGGIMVANELGAGDLKKGKLYGDRLYLLSLYIGLFCCLVLAALTVPIVRFMDLSDEASRDLFGMLIINAVYMIGRCLNQVAINGIFAAGGDTAFDLYSLAVTMWGISVPLSILGAFVFKWPVLLVYSFSCMDEFAKSPWVYLHYRKYKWLRVLTRDEITNGQA